MTKKAQATKKANGDKKPLSTKVGRGLTMATMGAAFWAGRTGARVGKNFAAGIVEAGREVKRGYDEGKADA